MKIATKLSLLIVITSLISLTILGFVIFNQTKSSIAETLKQEQLRLAKETLDKIDRFLYERLNNIQAISEDEEFEGFLVGKDANDPKEIAESSTKLQELTQYTGPWNSLSLVNTEGKVVLSVGEGHAVGVNIKEDLNAEADLDKVLKGEAFFSDAFLDDESGKPTMIFMSPIRNEEDPKKPVVGVALGHLAWPVITELIESVQGPVVDLYNNEGLEIANNDDPEAIFKENNSHHDEVKNALVGKEQSKVTTSIDSNEETVSSTALEKGFLNYHGNRWILLIEQPTNIAFAPAVSSAVKITTLLVAALFISSGLILLLILRVLRPIGLLTRTSREIAAGDLSKRVEVKSKDEIGQLGFAFNNMTSQLQTLYQNLEQKVQEKTTELGKKVNELQSEKAKDEAILNSLTDGMIVTDTSGNIVMVNALARQLLGLPSAVLTGHSVYYLTQFYSSDGKAINQKDFPIFISLTYGQKWTSDLTINTIEGKKRIINITSTVIVKDNTRVGGIAILRDVTKQKEIDRMKTEFISLASHQLRTPLSAIKWFSEMLVGGDAGELSPEQKDFAKNISDSTERMIQLVNSLLNISRIESGRIIVDPKPTDLKELVSGIINDLKGKTEEKQQNLVISVHSDLPKVNLDPRLIGQVYMNLLTNAIKYTPKGGDIQVFISKKDNRIISQVTDNGYGIPKAEQAKVFQKFFRADNVVKVETDGTGLGLYLVKAIIESSGGQIWFSSDEGKGTSFWFSLPLSGMEARAGEVTLDS